MGVNNCIESMVGPSYANREDYAIGLVASELLSFNFLLPSIREKGGAYGAGCRMNESGLIDLFSYRDPRVSETYDNFERAINAVVDGHFGDREMQESKLLAFQKLDRVVEPSLKGLVEFTRGYSDEQRLQIRLCALDCSK
jgi:Zn-dependent M16 (insulinase) family peptidase